MTNRTETMTDAAEGYVVTARVDDAGWCRVTFTHADWGRNNSRMLATLWIENVIDLERDTRLSPGRVTGLPESTRQVALDLLELVL